MTRNGDTLTLSTGRKVYANCGIVGINDKLSTSEGYDGDLPTRDEFDPESDWAADERRELADYMIALWTRYRGEA